MLKVFVCSDLDAYAALNAEQAAELFKAGCGEPCEEGYPFELGDAALDERHQAFDVDEKAIEGKTISFRELLADFGDEPGWLCAVNY